MSDKKITQLNELIHVAGSAIIPLVAEVSGVATTVFATKDNFLEGYGGGVAIPHYDSEEDLPEDTVGGDLAITTDEYILWIFDEEEWKIVGPADVVVGTVNSIIAGDGIAVNNTDPTNPVISSAHLQGIYSGPTLNGVQPAVPMTLNQQPLYFNNVGDIYHSIGWGWSQYFIDGPVMRGYAGFGLGFGSDTDATILLRGDSQGLKFPQLTPGSGTRMLTINSQGIVGTDTIPVAPSLNWGNITGDITDQDDLQDALNAKYDATNPSNFTSNTGTVTSVATGDGLTGGPVTGSGTIALASGTLESLVLADTAVQVGDDVDSLQMNTGRLLGRTTADYGLVEEIFVGSGMTLENGVLSAIDGDGGGTPGGSNTQVQYNNNGVFGGITNAFTDGTHITLDEPRIKSFDGSTGLARITYASTSSNALFVIPAVGASASFIMNAGNQTMADDKTFSGNAIVTGSLWGGSTTYGTGHNFYMQGGATGGGTTNSAYLFGGAASISFNNAYGARPVSALTADRSHARLLFAQQVLTEAASGTHPLLAQLAIRPMSITDNGATITNAATLYIEGAAVGNANPTNNYALWVDSGTVRLDSTLLMSPVGTGAGNTAEIRFHELAANGADYVAFKAPDALATPTTYVLPTALPPGSGQILSSTDTGELSWIEQAIGGGDTPTLSDVLGEGNNALGQDIIGLGELIGVSGGVDESGGNITISGGNAGSLDSATWLNGGNLVLKGGLAAGSGDLGIISAESPIHMANSDPVILGHHYLGEPFLIKYSLDHGTIYFGDTDLLDISFPGTVTFYANTGLDGLGSWAENIVIGGGAERNLIMFDAPLGGIRLSSSDGKDFGFKGAGSQWGYFDFSNIETTHKTFTFPNATGTIALTSDIPAAGANTALSNLASVAINVSLVSDTDSTDDLGSSSIFWKDLFVDNVAGPTTFNEAGADVDFRFEGDTEENLLFLDASTDRIGIGTNTPLTRLQVNIPTNDTTAGFNLVNAAGTSGDVAMRFVAQTARSYVIGIDRSNSNILSISTDSNASAILGDNDILRLSDIGNLGVGGNFWVGALTNRENSNFDIAAGTGVGSASSVSQKQLLGVQTRSRIIERGSNTTTIQNGDAYASHIIGIQGISEPNTGAIPIATQFAVRPLTIDGNNGDTTNSTTVYIEGPSIGTAAPINSYALWVDAGVSRFDGPITHVVTGEPASDHSAYGPSTNMHNAGTTITAMQAVFLNPSDGEWGLADADAEESCAGEVGIALDAGSDGNPLIVAIDGAVVRDDSWDFASKGLPVYISDTAGAVTTTPPSDPEQTVRRIGYTWSDDSFRIDLGEPITLNE